MDNGWSSACSRNDDVIKRSLACSRGTDDIVSSRSCVCPGGRQGSSSISDDSIYVNGGGGGINDVCPGCLVRKERKSADASCVNAYGGGINSGCAGIKREPTRLLEELCCCGTDGAGTNNNRGVGIINNTPPRTNASENAVPRPKYCKPVLLAFSLSPKNAAHGGKVPYGGSDCDYQLPRISEHIWLSQWKGVFPDVNYRNPKRQSVSPPVDRKTCPRQGFAREALCGIGEGVHVEDDVTWECLWGVGEGRPNLKLSTSEIGR